jgi:RimJ/RimL family protein N-acetyltransferase
MTAGSMERTLVRSATVTGPIGAGPAWAGLGSGLIRTAGPGDADRIRAFVCGLSSRSQYFRFFASVAPPSTGLMRALCGEIGSADILILTDNRGAVIGHAMAADARRADGSLEASIGVVIADEWQERGLGTTLLSMLVSRATGRGVSALVLDVLPANDRMRGIISRRWPDAPAERTRDAIVIRPQIGPVGPADFAALPVVIALPRAATHLGGTRARDRSAA